MRSFLVLWPSSYPSPLQEFLQDAAQHGRHVHFPASPTDPGAVETTDPALMLGAMPERIRNHLRSGEWISQIRFYGVGDLDISSKLISVCAELGVEISVWRSVSTFE